MTWSKTDIQQARKVPLAPLLVKQGYTLREAPGQNYHVEKWKDLFVKDSYWIWRPKNLYGNTIDFFIKIENLTFAQTMQIIVPR
jgi:hypothetical protein